MNPMPADWASVLEASVSFWVTAMLFLLPLRRRRQFHLRAAACLAMGIAAQSAFWLAFYPAGWAAWGITALHTALALLLFALCADISRTAVCYCAIWTISIQELAFQLRANLQNLCQTAGWAGTESRAAALLSELLFLAVIGLTLARWMPVKGRYQIGPRQMSGAAFSFLALQILIGLSGDELHIPRAPWSMLLLMEFYCVTLLYIQNEMFKKSAMRQEIVVLNRIQAQQKSQYAAAKENIALLNRKCHDLKHQLSILRALDEQRREPYLQELEGIVNAYDSMVCNTGNQVLNTVLTEKSLQCQANGIQAHCVADGKQLAFLDPVDLYTIFGNALDNAIEHVKTFADPERRIIDVMVSRERQFVIVQIINPAIMSPRFDEDGLPLTTKEDKRNHGFGLKSIRRTAAQYDGFLTIAVENGCFCLRVLFPCPNS